MLARITIVAATVVAFLPNWAAAQGLLLDERADQSYVIPRVIIHPRPESRPIPPSSYRIKELALQVTLQDQIAKTQVSQSFVNTGSRQMEVCFIYPLPYDGAIDRMTFIVDGKEYPAKLMTAEEARRIYEGHVRRNQDPALVEWIGRGMFKTSVFPVPPGAERKVTLRYTQLCRQYHGLTELLLPMSTAKYSDRPIESVTIDVAIKNNVEIKNVYSPTHAIRIERPSEKVARIQYTAENEIPHADFRLLYDVGRGQVNASLISYRPDSNDEGYFLLLVSPEIKKAAADRVVSKNIVFVVDRSGSMSGKKIEQAKSALRFVLNNLNEGDLFNIVAYDNEVESFQPELQRYNEENRKAALGFVEGIYAGGSTNIDGALQAALGQLQDDSRPNYVVFLTDGLPTAGERKPSQIVQNAEKRNKVRSRIFSFGVGFDVNSLLLDKLSRACHGQSLYVRPNEDIEAHVSRLYERIGAPVLTNVDIRFDMENREEEHARLVSRLYPRETHDLFAGEQLVLVGRYRQVGAGRVRISGHVQGERRSFDFPVTFEKSSSDETQAFVEKLWALRRVGEIIDEMDLQGKNQELIDELIALATQHGILTPYTSFLADETTDHFDSLSVRLRTDAALSDLSVSEGRAGFVQRELKQNLLQAGQAAPVGQIRLQSVEEDREVEVKTVKQVGRKTFLLRNGQWMDSTLTEAQQKNARQVERYSKEYFELVRRVGKNAAPYFALEGKVTVVVDGQAYQY